MAKAAKVYACQLLEEVNEEREKLGKPLIEEDKDGGPSGGEMVEKTVSTIDPDCGMFMKGAYERQFTYEAYTACDKKGFVLGVEVTSENVHDNVAWDALYDQVSANVQKTEYFTMDAVYKTPWIMKKLLDNGIIPLVPYTRYKGRRQRKRLAYPDRPYLAGVPGYGGAAAQDGARHGYLHSTQRDHGVGLCQRQRQA